MAKVRRQVENLFFDVITLMIDFNDDVNIHDTAFLFFLTEKMFSCPFENFLRCRFNIKQINEFYGSTEGNCSVGNFSNKYESIMVKMMMMIKTMVMMKNEE